MPPHRALAPGVLFEEAGDGVVLEQVWAVENQPEQDEWDWPVVEPGCFLDTAGTVGYWMVQEALDRFPMPPAWMKSSLTGPEWRRHLGDAIAAIYDVERERHVDDVRIKVMAAPLPLRRKASIEHMRDAFGAVMAALGGPA